MKSLANSGHESNAILHNASYEPSTSLKQTKLVLLLQESEARTVCKKLRLNTVKNIIDASFRVMIRMLSILLPTRAHALFTRMRPSEALALTWGDVDLRRGKISIEKSLYLGEEGSTKTKRSEPVIRGYPTHRE